MIVTTADRRGWICLARRGMLHSECDGVDLWALAPGEVLDGQGRDGACEAWFVVSGRGLLTGNVKVTAGDLVLRDPASWAEELVAADAMRVLVLTVLPEATARMLPGRAPELPAGRRSPGW